MAKIAELFCNKKNGKVFEQLSYYSLIIDFVSLLILIFIYIKTLQVPQEIYLFGDNEKRLGLFLWTMTPVFSIYLFLRILRIPFLPALILTAMLFISLSSVNNTKMAITGEPLSWTDLTATDNILLAIKYANKSLLFFYFFVIILVSFITFKISSQIKTRFLNYSIVVCVFFISSVFALTPYILSIENNNYFLKEINQAARNVGIVYNSWDLPQNFREHGLPIHLIQTSVRKTVNKATSDERDFYHKEEITNKNSVLNTQIPHQNIIYILCESCWYDSNHFKDSVSPLLTEGFRELRAISPVYGGGTANSEFEMLTGLPSAGKTLSGIIYMEYSELINPHSHTLASALRSKGYETFAAHNNDKTFWRRNVINKKFGFDKFLGIDSMGTAPDDILKNKKPWQWQPDDILLYDTAVKELQNNANKNVFMHLVSMSTHGPYGYDNDFGEGRYHYELTQAMQRISGFVKEVEKISPDTVFVIYGDHKPGLNRFFFENGILPAVIFDKTGKKDEDFSFVRNVSPVQYGDVPVLIKSPNKEAVDNVINEASGQPFFCLTGIIDKNLIHSGLVTFSYVFRNSCDKNLNLSYSEMTDKVPGWLYSLSIFE